jgi:hypothetical protein
MPSRIRPDGLKVWTDEFAKVVRREKKIMVMKFIMASVMM